MSASGARLLIAGLGGLACLAASGCMLVLSQRRAERMGARVEAVASAYGPPREAAGPGLLLRAASLAGRTERLLGYNPARVHVYRSRLPATAAASALAALAAAKLASGVFGPAAWAAAPVAGVLLCRAYHARREAGFQARLYVQFPDALAMIVRAVRVGLPVVEAIRVVARETVEPTAREFGVLVSQTAIGVPLDETLREMAENNRLPEYRFFATALSLQSQTGGGLTETLEGLADTIRKRVAAKARGHALAAEARMSSYILGSLPIVTLGLLSVVNPGYISVLFVDPTGRKLLYAGIGLLGVGAVTMRTLIRKSLS